MENYQGDLTDIIRATGSSIAAAAANTAAEAAALPAEWQFPNNPVNYPPDQVEDFGDPFTHLRDPLLHDVDTPVSSGFFHNTNIIKTSVELETVNTGGFVNGSMNLAQKVVLDDEMKRPSNIFSRMLQISPNAKLPLSPCDSPAVVVPQLPPQAAASPRGLTGPPPMLISNDHHTLISPGSPSLQISSPRNTGIKRRKSQAKKVVCIPAPAPANSRSSGEVVPSDLWAWRKYGQKPIKGSPYPRGYYRCSSSKGCSARKQVERSRTDPNMLVITYTSEHNHPWPTQRNALAGSTRSQPSKTNTAAKNSPNSRAQKCTNPKEEQKEMITTENAVMPSSSNLDAPVKEEMDQDFDNQMDDADEGFPHSYKPALPDSEDHDSFFADLGEIEADSLDMLFTQGFSGDDGREDKALDPFSFYDWAGNNSSTSAGAATSTTGAGSSYGEDRKDPDS
ncbi:hypothetical protein CDL12_09598 [Handroanthus impetiginosus]|uniref:WRKY domain-containing protein n=1 Tax=Handroanthus impetiginosus TaxID=429701 RepID=A0A2G9HJZ5_9LAMI|nr:hypothetical protein CDL12_09598 [Handroanthus impetiginosus]